MTVTIGASESRRALGRRVLSLMGAGVGVALVPKCPLCVAAYLLSLGIGAETAWGVAPWMRPLAWLALLGALGALVMRIVQRWRRIDATRAVARCCGLAVRRTGETRAPCAGSARDTVAGDEPRSG